MDTAGQYGELISVPFRREILEEASPWEGFLGFLSHQLASTDLAIFNTPLDLVIGFEPHCRANGLRESHAVILVDYSRAHVEIIPQERPCFKRFLQDRVDTLLIPMAIQEIHRIREEMRGKEKRIGSDKYLAKSAGNAKSLLGDTG